MVAILLKILTWTAILGVLIFWPAGTLAYPGAWAFLALFALGGAAMTLWLSRHSPSLLRERMALPVQRDQKAWDRVFMVLFILGFAAWLIVMGWDAARTSFAAVSPRLQALGGIAIVLNMLGTWWTFRENAFAAPVVKLQEGQRVIDTGPYAIVRHPMYASVLLFFLGLPLLLGSWLGLALSAVFILAIAWRAVHEERALCVELGGYESYAGRVRYRFVPLIW
jgi:protein-S-isoprenylcysteine O-methyltransferase Ste14